MLNDELILELETMKKVCEMLTDHMAVDKDKSYCEEVARRIGGVLEVLGE